MSTSAKHLDKDDLDLLDEIIGYWEETARSYVPLNWKAWDPLLGAGFVERSSIDPKGLIPTIAGSVYARGARAARKAKPSD